MLLETGMGFAGIVCGVGSLQYACKRRLCRVVEPWENKHWLRGTEWHDEAARLEIGGGGGEMRTAAALAGRLPVRNALK